MLAVAISDWPGAGLAQGCPLPQLDDDTDVADDDRDEGEHELCDVSESSIYEFIGLLPRLLTEHLVGGWVLNQLHEQSITVNEFCSLLEIKH